MMDSQKQGQLVTDSKCEPGDSGGSVLWKYFHIQINSGVKIVKMHTLGREFYVYWEGFLTHEWRGQFSDM